MTTLPRSIQPPAGGSACAGATGGLPEVALQWLHCGGSREAFASAGAVGAGTWPGRNSFSCVPQL
eukprot:CAMPEP_0168364136 /NCGR_PEP_ID=MMETSP0228-20121227/4052_1 /TAXON_ID=133427 /ORGANISM="Protoceratium reticulatum, Strain CCCM 535 (=CCMP 1889)" /LENGTH=64 /DNA_ID=CAMNT_0008376887 /DNA_START=343 /DNA_END=534 /DNA_ORIENTATION=+